MKFSEFLLETADTANYTVYRDAGLYTMDEAMKFQKYPDTIPTDFAISYNQIRSLKGCPSIVKGSFYCNDNKLTTLKGGPKQAIAFYQARDNKLTSIEGLPEITSWLILSGNKIESLHNIHKILKSMPPPGIMNLGDNPLKGDVLGLLLIPGLKTAEMGFMHDENLDKVNEIVNKYLPNTRGNDAVMECQTELIDAGLDEYAQL